MVLDLATVHPLMNFINFQMQGSGGGGACGSSFVVLSIFPIFDSPNVYHHLHAGEVPDFSA